MHEHNLQWSSSDGTGENVSLESDTVSADRFWGVVEDVAAGIFEADEDVAPELATMTRDQFRQLTKALVESGHFRMAIPRDVASHRFVSGKGWKAKA